MTNKLTTLNLNIDEVLKRAEQKKLRILAIVNGEIKCSYRDALKEVQEYEELVPQMLSGNLFVADAKCLLVDRFKDEIKKNERAI